jgi:uncharacterized protein YdeI (YjbR/CyaY-like superfamily)
MEPVFFATPADFRAWFVEHAATATELLVGFYRKGTGRPSITWPESVDQALCFGWIDGVRRGIDEHSYSIRFTPRQKRSNWSAVNVRRVAELTEQGLMQPAGLAAFEARTGARTAIYSYEQRHEAAFTDAQEKRFRARRKAWAFFTAQPPGYQTLMRFWVASAKREQTQEDRLTKLIEASAEERRL